MKKVYITVNPDKELKKQGDLFGLFFEDLNHAADGGLYGELVQNRSFEFDPIDNPEYHGMTAWETVRRGTSLARAHVDSVEPLNDKNQHFLRMEVIASGKGGGIRNLGYGSGIPIEDGKTYQFSCYYRRVSGNSAPVIVRLENIEGNTVYAESGWEPGETQWTKMECELTASGTDFQGRLAIITEEPVTIDLDMVSLFPGETFCGRKNGLRKDIAEMLRDMKPAFMRFPGGCLVHIGSLNGEDRNSIYRWKNTIGPVENRPSRRNSWNYNQTLGLGYFEYFQFCEDIGAEPVPVIPAGYDPHNLRAAPLNEMQEWIDEALDLIEFANGDASTEWGAVRAGMGHPESFHLKYLAIGNEEVGDEFFERYEMMLYAIKEKYPEVKVLGSAGPSSSGSEYEIGWEQARRTPTDYLDEHFYQCPEWFIGNAERYMDYPADGPKVFLGEYASQGKTWRNALAEAAFMIGMEKAPAMGLACYAPMLCHVDYVNWQPDMLYYNNHQVFGSPSYYIQKLFMRNKGDALIETTDNIQKREKTVPCFSGSVGMRTDRGEIAVSHFIIEDLERGTTTEVPDFIISPEHPYQDCAGAAGSSFRISFTFKKGGSLRAANLEGQQAFFLEYARRDDKNKMVWTIDGWERMTSLSGFIHGFSSNGEMRRFESDPCREHQAMLTVENSKVTTYIDQVKYCEYTYHYPDPDVLYYSAVREENEVIIKAANVEEEEKQVMISVPGCASGEATLTCIEDVRLEDENSFEEPEKVAPREVTVPVTGDTIYYTVKGNSFGVFRIKIKE